MRGRGHIPIDVADLLPLLDRKLIELLRTLSPDQWNRQTIAKKWVVKDVAAHLLDGNIRLLSIFRDDYFGEPADTSSYQNLVAFLNRLNADWVQAMKRVSPQVLVAMLEVTGRWFCDYFRTMDPLGKSRLAVDWAGESESLNWMEIAREYTEKWLHQQQIRDTLGNPDLMTRELFYPFIDIFMLALPHTYRAIEAPDGTMIRLTVSGDIGGSWSVLRREGQWLLERDLPEAPTTEVIVDPDTAWKLFSKSLRPADVRGKISVAGNQGLGEVALGMVSVMA